MRLVIAFISLFLARPGQAEPLTGIFDGSEPPVSLTAMLEGGSGAAVDARDAWPVSVDNGPSESERRQVRINGELLAEARRGNADDVRALLRQGAYINTKDSYGRSPLMLAAYHGRVEVARVLVSSGAHLNSRSDGGETALHYAVEQGNLEVVRVLAGAPGINLNQTDSAGYTPIQRARSRGYQEIVDALRAAGATAPPDS